MTTRLGEPPPVRLLSWSRGGLVNDIGWLLATYPAITDPLAISAILAIPSLVSSLPFVSSPVFSVHCTGRSAVVRSVQHAGQLEVREGKATHSPNLHYSKGVGSPVGATYIPPMTFFVGS